MKSSCAIVLAFVLPAGVSGQQPAGTPPAHPITAALSVRIVPLHRNLSLAFDSIPADKFSFRPTPAQQTIGYIAQHLANDNYLFCSAFGEMKPQRPEEDTATPDSVKATWPKDKLVAKLKESFTFCATALNQLDDAKLADQMSVSMGGNTRQVTRAARVLGHAMDMADHYSQLANYMRLNNILPPTALPRTGRSGGGGGTK